MRQQSKLDELVYKGFITTVKDGRGYIAGYKKCRQCGYETTEDFDFCPKCGTRF